MECAGDELPSTSSTYEEAGRGCRNKRKQVDPTICPVCSCTLRNNEVDHHLNCEIEKLQKINIKCKQQNGKCISLSPTNSNGSENGIDKQWETYQKVKTNRHCRQKSKSKRRKTDEVVCPVCNRETNEDINLHVERCLQKTSTAGNSEESDENIDVEGYEEYEWAGQSRVRATSLLQGGVSSLGMSLTMGDEDEDLVVDGDDTQIYGCPQYSERDIILADSDKERDALRKAVLGSGVEVNKNSATEKCSMDVCEETTGDPVLEALKSRIRELENHDSSRDEVYKCLICMERYHTPVISVCCWHVHCEVCWLQTLGAKKLCPQCNMITSPADLRRIYM